MKTYKYDSEIADLVHTIMNNGTMTVETFNESVLMELFKLRGTPIEHKSNRDSAKDYAQLIEEDTPNNTK